MAPIPRLAAYDGPPLFSYGFRPFFLAGSIWAAIAIGLWLPAYFGEIALPTAFSGLDWHVHEMLYGFLPAMVTGFLLTAIPNWTGRLPLQGRPLIVLAAVWLAGRIAILTSAWTSLGFAAAVDLAFLMLVGLAAGREVVAGGNWRNLKVVAILSVFAIGNLVFHLEAAGVIAGRHDHDAVGHYGIRIGLGAGVLLIMLIGGRIVPSFTRNWLARENPGRLPATPNRFDLAATLIAVVSIAAWIAAPQGTPTAGLLALSAVLQATRLARWAGDRTWRDRLVLILHVAYAFVPLGFALNAAAALDLVPASAGLHAWAVGAVGTMSLAVMSRASLGHTGRALVASPAAQLAYLAVVAATLARICAAVRPEWAFAGLHVAAFAWVAAFGLFVAAYFRVLAGPRAAGRP